MQSYHAGQVDVGQAADQGLTQAGELQVQGLVLLLYLFVLLLHVLQVLFHRRDLQQIGGHKDREMFRYRCFRAAGNVCFSHSNDWKWLMAIRSSPQSNIGLEYYFSNQYFSRRC